jgi:ribosome-binding protein aMBF1 (putative translation factor)
MLTECSLNVCTFTECSLNVRRQAQTEKEAEEQRQVLADQLAETDRSAAEAAARHLETERDMVEDHKGRVGAAEGALALAKRGAEEVRFSERSPL